MPSKSKNIIAAETGYPEVRVGPLRVLALFYQTRDD